MKKKALVAAVCVVALFGILQLVPVARTNPPVVADLEGPPQLRAVLRSSCYDCHSNETRWPWYSHVAPVSWLVAHDVEEARDHLNLSLWGTYPPERQRKAAQEMWEEVRDGDMPLLMYRVAHPEARMSDAGRATLEGWVSSLSDNH